MELYGFRIEVHRMRITVEIFFIVYTSENY